MSKGRFVDIFVEPNSSAPSGYQFSMEDGGVGTNTLVFDKNTENMRKSEDFKIEFKLHNRKGADLCFSKVKEKVMWAMATDGPTGECPPEGSSFPGFYVDPTSFMRDDVLTVINTDKTQQYFSFCLNFVPRGTKEDSDTKYILYDPIGDNRNGGTGFSAAATTAVVAVAVVAAVAVAAYVAYS